jgi:hypothetical protein
MRSRHLLWGGVSVIGAAGVLGGASMLSLSPACEFTSPPPIRVLETQALLAALKPPTRGRPSLPASASTTRRRLPTIRCRPESFGGPTLRTLCYPRHSEARNALPLSRSNQRDGGRIRRSAS